MDNSFLESPATAASSAVTSILSLILAVSETSMTNIAWAIGIGAGVMAMVSGFFSSRKNYYETKYMKEHRKRIRNEDKKT